MPDISASFGYEEGRLVPRARALAWIIVAFLAIGVFGAALIDNAALMNWGLRISFVATIAGYVHFCRVSLRGGATPVVAFLPRGAWSVILLAVSLNVVNLMYAVLNAPLFGAHSVDIIGNSKSDGLADLANVSLQVRMGNDTTHHAITEWVDAGQVTAVTHLGAIELDPR